MFFLSLIRINKNKLEPFECGFTPTSKLNTRFSVHFFVVLLFFLIFDLEVVLVLTSLMSGASGLLVFTFIMIFIVGGVYLEITLGKLQ